MNEHLPRNAVGDVQFVPPPGFTSWPPVQKWDEALWSHWLTQHRWTAEEIAGYIDRDRFAYGVGITPTGERAGPHNAYEPGVKWLYNPTPKGVTLHATRHSGVITNILWGGSAGGTKSMSARWEAIDGALFSQREDYRAIIVRRELEELRRTHLDDIATEADKINEALGMKAKDGVTVTTQPPVATFNHTGAKILMGHCQNPEDHKKYLGDDYDLFVGDEATTLLWKQIVGIQGRVRNDTKINRIGRMILTTNPGGPSHHECVEHFITKAVDRTVNKKYKPETYKFIQAALYDNPYYMDADGSFETYEARLWLYDAERRRQLLDGDWSVIVNSFFVHFDPRLHVRAFAA